MSSQILAMLLLAWVGVSAWTSSGDWGATGIFRISQQNGQERHDKILRLIERSRLEAAEQLIEEALKDNPHDLQIHLLRHALATGLMRAGRRDDGERQLEKILEYMFEHPRESQTLLKHLSRILVNLSWIRQNIEPRASQTLEKAEALLRDAVNSNPANVAWSMGLSSVISFQARGLLNQYRFAEVQRLYDVELSRLRQRWRSHPENPDAWLKLAVFLKTAAEPVHPDHAEFANNLLIERDNLLACGADQFPNSAELVNEHFSNRLKNAELMAVYDVDMSIAMLRAAQLDFDRIISAGGLLKPILGTKLQIAKTLQHLTRQRARQQLIGRQPPELENIDWINSGFTGWTSAEDSSLVVVLFSVTKPGSTAELIVINDILKTRFPKARLLALTHGFQQSFSRVEIARRKNPPAGASDLAVYRQQLDEKFVKANRFEFPVGIINDSADLADALGVEQVPFSMIVDASGICLHLIEGADQARAVSGALEKLHTSPAKTHQ